MAVFCKKKGFVYPSSELYGGFAGFFDYGPLGVELKNSIKQSFWKRFVQSRDDIAGIDGAIIANPKIWEASGHVACFEDVLVEDIKTKERFRADHLIEQALGIKAEGLSAEELAKIIKENKLKSPKGNDLTEPKKFNLMFETNVGPVSGNPAYLRPETAQLIFANFKLVQENSRLKLPFGIAQIGKAFRNEISPRDFLFRSREFEQMEIEFFTHPAKTDDCAFYDSAKGTELNVLTAEMQRKKQEHKAMKIDDLYKKKLVSKWHAYWLAEFYQWFLDLGIKKENLRLREHLKDELAHYAGACFDIEYKFPFGWKEIHGNADRKQFDLEQHSKHSKKDITYFDEDTKEKVVPYVASEPSQGVDRAFLAFLFDAYNDDKERGNIVLKLNPKLAPIKAGVFPLVNKLNDEAKKIFNELKAEFNCVFDKSGSVGRRYARADELGIPYCVTVDFDTLDDKSVTIRDRDTTKQVRVKITELKDKLSRLLNSEIKLAEAGKEVTAKAE
ncbi:glycine--tRNA ligase [Candidatus Woesearchaeota archaeon]|nr:glycine--tRNA ligase [Candidatus Woesearchaeota archaeon]